MKSNVIALDIDDCIFPNNNNWFGQTDDSVEMLEINLKRLKLIVEKFDMEIFIISSASTIMNYHKDTKDISYIYDIPEQGTKEYKYHSHDIETCRLMSKYLKGNISGIATRNKTLEIQDLINNYDKVVIMEDSDFQSFDDENDNCFYCYTHGFIDGKIGAKIMNFIQNNSKDLSNFIGLKI